MPEEPAPDPTGHPRRPAADAAHRLPASDPPADEKPSDDGEVRAREAAIDAALDMTFPASDSPPWSP